MSNKFAEHDMDLALTAYFDAMRKDYGQTSRDVNRYNIYADKPGQKFLRIINNSWGQRSSHSFIVIKAHKTSSGLDLKVGDILKCASWKAPALNFIRGNILEPNYGNCAWTGAA